MAALDTNVLVRFLVADDAAQHAAAVDLVRRSVASGATLFVPATVLLELEWVLRSVFKFEKATLVKVLSDLLATVELRLQDEHVVEHALLHYRDGDADFSDCMHVASAAQAGEAPLWTFDKGAARLDGARLLAS